MVTLVNLVTLVSLVILVILVSLVTPVSLVIPNRVVTLAAILHNLQFYLAHLWTDFSLFYVS